MSGWALVGRVGGALLELVEGLGGFGDDHLLPPHHTSGMALLDSAVSC